MLLVAEIQFCGFNINYEYDVPFFEKMSQFFNLYVSQYNYQIIKID